MILSCLARLEVKVIDRASGKVIFEGAEHSVAIDLGENVAAKKALQKAGYALGEKILLAVSDFYQAKQ